MFSCLLAFILNFNSRETRELEIIIGLIFIRLIRFHFQIYEMSAKINEFDYEDLELKFQKMENALEKVNDNNEVLKE